MKTGVGVRFVFRAFFHRSYHNIRNMKQITLSQSGDRMPTIGLGTWQAPPDVIESTVYKALDIGYRHIDTAFNYNNEDAIGKAIKKWIEDGKGAREDLFITTKLPHVGNRASDVRKFLNIQLSRLQVAYVDLYLIHVPFGFHCNEETLTPVVKENGDYDLDMDTNHTATWMAMEECKNGGLIRNLGLSNFNETQIENIMKAARIKPQVLQVELHAYFQQLELRRYCAENDIVVTAYAPLGSPGAKDHFVNKYNYRAFFHRSYHNIRNMKQITLSQSGDRMPTIGLGTWQAPPDVIESTVYKALDIGYRHIDTAFNYNNEDAIGKAIKKWIEDGKGAREDLFITTKLPHVGNRASDVRKFLNIQLSRLQVAYVDLYLIHVPFGFHCNEETLTPVVKENGDYDLDMDTNHTATWMAMEECKNGGLIRNLGLSNFNETQIENIMKAARIKPQVLQVELHAYFQQLELRRYCAENDIVVTAYAPLGSPGAKDHFVNKYNYSPESFPDLLGLPDVKYIAEQHKKTPAQVLIHFLLQQRVVVIPKSTSENRLKENIDVYDFELSPAEMNRLKKLDKGEAGRIFNFLFWKGVEKHPEYPFKGQIFEKEK